MESSAKVSRRNSRQHGEDKDKAMEREEIRMNFLEERILKDGIVKRWKCAQGGQLPEPSDGYRAV